MAGNRWTEEELAKLAETYPRVPWEDVLAALPRHAYKSITARATRLGIRRKHGVRPAWLKKGRGEEPPAPGEPKWKPQEFHALAELYPAGTRERIEAGLPGRSWAAIARKAALLGIRREARTASLDARHPEDGTARAEAAPRRRAPDYGPYDPSSRCGECAHYRLARRDGGCYAGICGCWKIRGKDGGYLHVRSSKPSCRHFVQGGIGGLGCQPAGARKR